MKSPFVGAKGWRVPCETRGGADQRKLAILLIFTLVPDVNSLEERVKYNPTSKGEMNTGENVTLMHEVERKQAHALPDPLTHLQRDLILNADGLVKKLWTHSELPGTVSVSPIVPAQSQVTWELTDGAWELEILHFWYMT